MLQWLARRRFNWVDAVAIVSLIVLMDRGHEVWGVLAWLAVTVMSGVVEGAADAS